jgi:hypothetical protein
MQIEMGEGVGLRRGEAAPTSTVKTLRAWILADLAKQNARGIAPADLQPGPFASRNFH